MASLREYTGELVVVRCWCGIQLGIPSSLRSEQLRRRDEGGSLAVFCPLGHEFVPSGESRLKKLERQLAQKDAILDQISAERDCAERRRRAEKAAKTRLKNRIASGACPCCKRHFVNLQRHMASKHPDFVEGEHD